MVRTMKDLGLDQWSAADRRALAEELWASLDDDPEQLPLTDAQRAELERRLARADADPASGVPWEAVKAAALARAKR